MYDPSRLAQGPPLLRAARALMRAGSLTGGSAADLALGSPRALRAAMSAPPEHDLLRRQVRRSTLPVIHATAPLCTPRAVSSRQGSCHALLTCAGQAVRPALLGCA